MSLHIGRSWKGHDLEDECPCPQAPCGLVDAAAVDPMCEEHPTWRVLHQVHRAERCPAITDQPQTAPAAAQPATTAPNGARP